MKTKILLPICLLAMLFCAPTDTQADRILNSIEYTNPIENKGLCGRIADTFCRRMFSRGELDFSWLGYIFEKVNFETIIVFNKFTHQLYGDKRDLIYKIKMRYKSGDPENLSNWKLLLVIIEDVDTQVQLVNKKYE